MACDTCDTPKPLVPAEPAKTVLSYRTTEVSVRGRDGVARKIAQPLVERVNIGSWRADFTINGRTERFDGQNAYEVFQAAKRFLAANSVQESDNNIWFNLNIQWLGRANEKRQQVHQSHLLQIAIGAPQAVEAEEAKATVRRRGAGPAKWGPKGWGMLQMYLAESSYEYGEFLSLATILSRWVNPDINPHLGCADCYQHYALALARLRKTPAFTQEEGRRWLWQLMNDVNGRRGIRLLTFEEASAINFWL